MHSPLRRIDLNLLLVFDALYRHRSVIAASEELAMSPSAFSHALSRLRETVSDELFVRYGRAMQPTDQAEQLALDVGQALKLLSSGLSTTGPFDPATSRQTFTFAASDLTALSILPALTARVERAAPCIKLKVQHTTHRDSLVDLASGRTQFVLGFADAYSGSYEGIETLDGITDDYVVVVSRTPGLPSAKLSLDHYIAAKHLVVMPWLDAGSVIDEALEKNGLKREVAVQIPTMALAPSILQRTGLMLTLPRRVASELFHNQGFVTYEAPFDTPIFTIKVLFHARSSGSQGHRWMREQLRLVIGAACG